MSFFEENSETGNVIRFLFYGEDFEFFESLKKDIDLLSWYYLVSNKTSESENVGTLSSDFFDAGFDVSFDGIKFPNFVGKELDFDVVFSKKLEHTSFISNIFYNRSRHRPSIISFLDKSDFSHPFSYSGLFESDKVLYVEKSNRDECFDRLNEVFSLDVLRKVENKFEEFGNVNSKVKEMVGEQKRISDNSEAIKDIEQKIKKEGSITKYQLLNWLNWGRQIAWTPYRRRLLDNSNISDVVGYRPKYIYVS